MSPGTFRTIWLHLALVSSLALIGSGPAVASDNSLAAALEDLRDSGRTTDPAAIRALLLDIQAPVELRRAAIYVAWYRKDPDAATTLARVASGDEMSLAIAAAEAVSHLTSEEQGAKTAQRVLARIPDAGLPPMQRGEVTIRALSLLAGLKDRAALEKLVDEASCSPGSYFADSLCASASRCQASVQKKAASSLSTSLSRARGIDLDAEWYSTVATRLLSSPMPAVRSSAFYFASMARQAGMPWNLVRPLMLRLSEDSACDALTRRLASLEVSTYDRGEAVRKGSSTADDWR